MYDNGLVAIDAADVYSSLVSGNRGGESETIIGTWLTKYSIARDKLVIFTKVGVDLGFPGKGGLSVRWITKAVDDSLRRLQTDYIDLYFAWPDLNTPYEETLNAYLRALCNQENIGVVTYYSLASGFLIDKYRR